MKHAGFNATYEGLVVKVKRIFIDRAGEIKQASTKAFVERAVTFAACSECGGTRLAAPGRSARINSTTIAECTAMQVSDLLAWLDGVTEPAVAPLVGNLRHTLASFVEIGLGYLSLDREPGTSLAARRSGPRWSATSGHPSPTSPTCSTSPPSGCTRTTSSG